MVTTVKKTDDDVYWAEKGDGEVIAENSSAPDSVFQAAFDEGGHITAEDGLYPLTLAGNTALKAKADSKIVASRSAVLVVPEGYAADVIEISTAYQGGGAGGKVNSLFIDGFTMREEGTDPGKLWNGYHFISSHADGMSNNKIQNTQFGSVYDVTNIRGPKRGVLLESTTTDGWMNHIEFENINMYSTVIGFEFKKDAVGGIPFNYINRVNFRRCTTQANGHVQYGWKGIDGEGHVFDDCRCYDFHNAAAPKIASQFLSTANKILILGGIMTINPTHMDWQCPVGNITVFDPFAYRQSVFTKSDNDGKTRTFTWPHGLSVIPTLLDVTPLTPDANISPFSKTADATNITITYRGTLPPPPTAGNPDNLQWYWRTTL